MEMDELPAMPFESLLSTAPARARAGGLKQAKRVLLDLCRDTKRGSRASLEARGVIEEVQIVVESHQGAKDLNYPELGGLWELQYTTATDVLPVIEADNFFRTPFTPGPIQVGGIYQRFTSPVDGVGRVDNIIKLSTPLLLEEDQGVTFTVQASYEVRSGHRIALAFNSAHLGEVRISELLESVLAPAILPRNSLQHALLMGIKQFEVSFPFRTMSQVANGVRNVRGELGSLSGSYLLTFLDEDMLIGRATALGNVFIFSRVPEPEC